MPKKAFSDMARANEMPKSSFPLLACANEMPKGSFSDMTCANEFPKSSFLHLTCADEIPKEAFLHLACAGLRFLQIIEEMSHSSQNPPPIPPSVPVGSLPKLDPVAALLALGSSVRWPIIKLLADGREMSITECAAVAGCTRENMGKQMLVLLNAGVVDCRFGEDRRQSIYSIPAVRRPAPGVIDYGFCKIDLKQA